MTNAWQDIEELAARYRRIAAPAGLPARIRARIDAAPVRRPLWLPAAAIGAAAVLTLIVALPFLRTSEPPAPLAQREVAPAPRTPADAAPAPRETVAARPAEPPERVTAMLAATDALADASAWLARGAATPAPDLGALPDVMSVQSIADIPDPFS